MFREEHGRALASLIRLLGDFERAEEALSDALCIAAERWPVTGVPGNPRAWLVQTGRNRAIDRLRREARFQARAAELLAEAASQTDPDTEEDDGPQDDVLRLIFTCCHPALALDVRVALTLRTVCGLSTGAVARAFLVAEPAMAQRLVRATRKIKLAGIPFEIPPLAVLDARLQDVLAVIYLVFTEDYGAGSPQAGLGREAIRLGYLIDGLMPGRGDVQGLLALMLLHDARRPARFDAMGGPVLLEDQDRSLWDHGQIARASALVEAALTLPGPPSPYAVQAAIAALHAQAPRAELTDWPQILGLYEVLARLLPTPVVELNRAVAVAMVDGPGKALDLIDSLAARGALSHYHLLHSARAALLGRLGRRGEAETAYRLALEMAQAEPDRRWLASRLDELSGG